MLVSQFCHGSERALKQQSNNGERIHLLYFREKKNTHFPREENASIPRPQSAYIFRDNLSNFLSQLAKNVVFASLSYRRYSPVSNAKGWNCVSKDMSVFISKWWQVRHTVDDGSPKLGFVYGRWRGRWRSVMQSWKCTKYVRTFCENRLLSAANPRKTTSSAINAWFRAKFIDRGIAEI